MGRLLGYVHPSTPHGPTELIFPSHLSGFIFSYICLFLVVLSRVDADVYTLSTLHVTVRSIPPGLPFLELERAGSWVNGAQAYWSMEFVQIVSSIFHDTDWKSDD